MIAKTVTLKVGEIQDALIITEGYPQVTISRRLVKSKYVRDRIGGLIVK